MWNSCVNVHAFLHLLFLKLPFSLLCDLQHLALIYLVKSWGCEGVGGCGEKQRLHPCKNKACDH